MAFAPIVAFLDRHRAWGAGFVRLVVGVRLVYGTWDNVTSGSRMAEFAGFLAANGFPLPMASAVVSVAVQFVGGLLLLLGLWVRPAAAVLAANFVVALGAVHLRNGDPFLDAYDAWVMLAGALALLFLGAGVPSADAALARRRGKAVA